MNIAQGSFEGVPLDGLSWAVVVHFPGAMHEGNGEAQPYIDAKATEKQRKALVQILSGQAGGPLFQIMVAVIKTLHEPQFVPIEFEFDKKRRRARVSSPGLFATVSEPLRVPATGQEQRVQVRLPDGGFEYKEAEVANASLIWAGGKVKMKHSNVNSSLADVEHTPAGLV
jgi:hypothetical protein